MPQLAAEKIDSPLIEFYRQVRAKTEAICEPLEVEDYVVQPASFVSPPKWHLAHTTWFFVNFILHPNKVDFPWPNEHYPVLFNSYYKSQGGHWTQGRRGDLSRPSVREILNFRKAADDALIEFVMQFNDDVPENIQRLMRLGLEHEQQHQELLLMDIKYILWCNPSTPSYSVEANQNSGSRNTTAINCGSASKSNRGSEGLVGTQFWQCEGGLAEFGVDLSEGDFCFDNETPKHKAYQKPFAVSHRPVSNAEFLHFIEDKAYQTPSLWLSEGWDYISQYTIDSPHYWKKIDNTWHEFDLGGMRLLNPNASVAHISFHEAYAFARWAGKRLPNEYEWEKFAVHALKENDNDLGALFLENELNYSPYEANKQHFINVHGGLWEWTSSPYSGYPGYRAADDAFGEYNGKFMINQMVLRGGCIATPRNHYRLTYRNFYQPTQRWQFAGVRLAEDKT